MSLPSDSRLACTFERKHAESSFWPFSTISITRRIWPLAKMVPANAIELNLTQTIVNSGLETVSVPAGTFVNADGPLQ